MCYRLLLIAHVLDSLKNFIHVALYLDCDRRLWSSMHNILDHTSVENFNLGLIMRLNSSG